MSEQKQNIPSHGKFVWHDLMTTDVPGAIRFYSALLGWEVKAIDMGKNGTYNLIFAGSRDIGGIVGMSPAECPTPTWVGYATVDSVEAAVGRAQQHGGRVVMPGMDIENVGRAAMVSDPTGGSIMPFVYRSDRAAAADKDQNPPQPGTFVWDELLTPDAARAKAFYTEVIGWGTSEMEIGPGMTYTLFLRGEQQAGGLMQLPKEALPQARWVPYIAVADTDVTVQKALELGARVRVPATDMPNVGRFALLEDPSGTSFGVIA